MKMSKFGLMLGAVSLLSTAAFAQGMGGGMGGNMRNSPKFRLTGLVRGFGQLEHDPRNALTPSQARVIVWAIHPWQSRPHMNDTQARDLYMKLNGVLTDRQKNDLDKIAAANRHFGGPGMGGGQGGPGRGGAGAPDMAKMRAQMQAMRGFMMTMNPFYPPTAYPEMKNAPERMRDRMERRYLKTKALLSELATKAKKK